MEFLGANFDLPGAGAQKTAQMPFNGDFIGDDAQKSQRRAPLHDVRHAGVAAWQSLEMVFVAHRLEDAARHLVGEKMGRVHLHNARAEPLPHSQMTAFESHIVAQFEKPCFAARNDAFAGLTRGFNVKSRVARQIEATWKRRVDGDSNSDLWH